MREVTFGTYRTNTDGKWTMSGLVLSDPVFAQNIVFVHGRSTPLDLSGALSDNDEPTYENRTLTVTLESSEGTRDERKTRISLVKNLLDGRRMNIIHPDFPDRYLTGRLSVIELFNDLAHASVQIVATVDPWFYSNRPIDILVTASADGTSSALVNEGRLTVVPTIEVVTDSQIQIEFGDNSWTGTAGTYMLPQLVLTTGSHQIKVTGNGSAKFTWREGIL